MKLSSSHQFVKIQRTSNRKGTLGCAYFLLDTSKIHWELGIYTYISCSRFPVNNYTLNNPLSNTKIDHPWIILIGEHPQKILVVINRLF